LTDTPLRPAFMTFLGAFLFCSALVFVITLFVDLSGNSALGIITVMASAMPAGQVFFTRSDRLPTTGEKARFALFATGVSVLLSLLLLIGAMVYYQLPLNLASLAALFGVSGSDLSGLIPIVLAGAAALTFVVAFFAFGFGAKGAMKQRAKLAAK
jgi:hypothetical protein